jgi:hypothetical protein
MKENIARKRTSRANVLRKRSRRLAAATLLAAVSIVTLAGVPTARADDDGGFFQFPVFLPFNLAVTRSVYVDTGSIVAGTTVLPPNCSPSNCPPPPVTAVTSSAYPYVFNNDTVDGNFGITSKIFLDQMTPFGWVFSSLEVPNSSQHGVGPNSDQMVTSFSSKSELAVNLSTDGRALTFMGYFAAIGAIDVSNSNTPGEIDPTVQPGNAYYRSVAVVDQFGKFHFTKTNAYTGDNGRAAILNDAANIAYMAGNAGNGSLNPQPVGVIISTGAQMLMPTTEPESAQTPGTPTAVGSFNLAQLGDKIDKIGKDTNFRGLTIFNNVLYYTKGSGGNGVNTVYFVDTTGTVCTDANGVGLPAPHASLPTSPLAYNTNPTVIQTDGMQPYNMCILKGLPTVLAKKSSASFPFGIWFANDTTLYVADEGSGNTGMTVADFYSPGTPAQNPTAGLQKWIFNASAGEWQFAYTLTNGLDLGVPYNVPGYPTGNNSGPGGSNLPWAPATDGLRNITGLTLGDTATIYATTSTISGSGDQGADPNKLVVITDQLSAATLPTEERFLTLRTAGFGEVLRGVAWTPGTVLH